MGGGYPITKKFPMVTVAQWYVSYTYSGFHLGGGGGGGGGGRNACPPPAHAARQ